MVLYITYFVHGTTYDNEKGLYTGWYDVDLSPKGIEQSIRLKELVEDRHFDLIICSDRKRAVQSAELTWGGVVPIRKEWRLREVNLGALDGTRLSLIEPRMAEHIDAPWSHGESYRDVEHRMRQLLGEWRQCYDSKHLGIVAHRAPQLSLDVITKGMAWEEAIANDWRLRKAWQPGWEYVIE